MLKVKRMPVVVLMGLLVLTAGTQAAAGPEKITVYMSPIPLAQELEATFEVEHGDVLTVVSGAWCRRVRAEMEAGDIKADVLHGADFSIYLMLRDAGQLLPYSSPELGAFLPEFRMEAEQFTLANGRYAVIMYNKRLISDEDAPSTRDDLLDPRWKGRVVIGDPLLCSAAFAIASSLVQFDGFDWKFVRGLRDNEVMLADTAAKVAEVVASGEALLGIGVLDAPLRMIKNAQKQGVESPLAIVWPEDGATAMPRPVAIVQDVNRSEESTAVAKEFVDFILSAQGQKIAAKYGFIPVRADVPTPPGVSTEFKTITPDWEWINQYDQALRDKWESVIYGE
ncbi:MAG TPA: extracellular solute-binding protein [Acidobacteriota bacterium]|nr:extracellular solute-binding protein [Acidobacteriota bacterium]HQP18662.1 extracellular solute-binding protein [Candidatus Cloacimonadota bacterium]